MTKKRDRISDHYTPALRIEATADAECIDLHLICRDKKRGTFFVLEVGEQHSWQLHISPTGRSLRLYREDK